MHFLLECSAAANDVTRINGIILYNYIYIYVYMHAAIILNRRRQLNTSDRVSNVFGGCTLRVCVCCVSE